MIRFPILAGTMLALIALPAAAEDKANLTTGAISQEGLPQISEETAGASLPVNLQSLSNHSVAAQQFGNLATTKGTDSLVGDLGDVMVLLHSQINDRLQSEGEIAAEDQQQLNELGDLNEEEFALGLAAWIERSYPEAIKAWKGAPREGEFGELADAVVEQMEGQLEVAQKISDAGGNLAFPDEQVQQTLSWGGAQEQGETAQQFHIEPSDGAEPGETAAQ